MYSWATTGPYAELRSVDLTASRPVRCLCGGRRGRRSAPAFQIARSRPLSRPSRRRLAQVPLPGRLPRPVLAPSVAGLIITESSWWIAADGAYVVYGPTIRPRGAPYSGAFP